MTQALTKAEAHIAEAEQIIADRHDYLPKQWTDEIARATLHALLAIGYALEAKR